MSLVVGENSWVTVVEADNYLQYKAGSEDWYELSEDSVDPGTDSKTLFLVTAFNILVNKGGYCLNSALTDDNVKKAQIEYAYSIFKGSFLSEGEINKLSSGLKSFTLSKWSETYNGDWTNDFPLPPFVSNFLSDYYNQNATVNLSRDEYE